MPNVIIGEQNYTEQPRERTHRPNRGWENVRRFRGNFDQLAILESDFIATGWTTKLVEGPIAELTCTIGGETDSSGTPISGGEVVSTWEISATAGEIDILRSDIGNSITYANDLKLLRDLVKGTKSFEGIDDTNFTDSDAYDVFKVLASGTTSRQIFYPTLRHTQTGSGVYSFSPALYAVGEVVSTSNLLANQPSIPDSIRNNLPDGGSESRTEGILYYGWLTSYPQISVTIDNKSQLIQEWQWGLWSNVIYPYNS